MNFKREETSPTIGRALKMKIVTEKKYLETAKAEALKMNMLSTQSTT